MSDEAFLGEYNTVFNDKMLNYDGKRRIIKLMDKFKTVSYHTIILSQYVYYWHICKYFKLIKVNMLNNREMPNIVSSKIGINPQKHINKQKRILFIISLLVLATVFGSCSSSRKAKKKCRECPEFSINHIQEKTS